MTIHLAQRLGIGRLRIDALSYSDAITAIMMLAEERRSAYVVTPNADHVVRAETDDDYRTVCEGADLVLADGMPLVLASLLLGRRLPGRVTGADLLPGLCAAATASDASVFLLGGLAGEADLAAARLTAEYPGLRVAGTYFPPFGFELDARENERIVAAINTVRPDLVFVGVGSPKQEKWIAQHRAQLACGVLLGVGIAIAFQAGTVRRAPRWIQKRGFEWLFRLSQEPRRLALRYWRNLAIFGIVLRTWRRRGEMNS